MGAFRTISQKSCPHKYAIESRQINNVGYGVSILTFSRPDTLLMKGSYVITFFEAL